MRRKTLAGHLTVEGPAAPGEWRRYCEAVLDGNVVAGRGLSYEVTVNGTVYTLTDEWGVAELTVGTPEGDVITLLAGNTCNWKSAIAAIAGHQATIAATRRIEKLDEIMQAEEREALK